MRRDPIRLAVLTPVFNDWDCLLQLIQGLSGLQNHADSIELVVVNDASTQPRPVEIESLPEWLESIKILDLVSNVGHQRAIAIGLCHVVSGSSVDAVLTLDSDGEDAPDDALNLMSFWCHHPSAITVATRGRRSEGKVFSLMYKAYKASFSLLTGRRLDFGNFAVLPFASAKRLAAMPELWNHYPSAILKSRIELRRLPVHRARRYGGQSSMGLVKWINHGLSSVSVFFDLVLARLLVVTVILAVLLVALACLVLAIKLFTTLAIPGWTSLVFGLTAVGLLQVLTTQVVVVFLALSSRSSFQRPTLLMADSYIESVHVIESS